MKEFPLYPSMFAVYSKEKNIRRMIIIDALFSISLEESTFKSYISRVLNHKKNKK